MKICTKVKALAVVFVIFLLSTSVELTAHQTSDEVLHSLYRGNKKFIKNPRFASERKGLVKAQNPPCVVLSCSDSRVPPELIFDKGLGELFVSRVAGNVADDVVIDSIEYAVTHFDVSVIVVMGHTNCGAVIGAINHLKANGGAIDPAGHGHLDAVLIPIETAIVQAGINIYAPEALKHSTRANIAYVANQLLSQSQPISNAVATGQLKIIGSEYNLKTGKVKQLFVKEK